MAGLSSKTTDDAIKNITGTKRRAHAPITTLPTPRSNVNLLERAGIDIPGTNLLSRSMQPPDPAPSTSFAAKGLENSLNGGRGGQVARARAIREEAAAKSVASDPPLNPRGKPDDYAWDARKPAPSTEITGILRRQPADWSATDALKVMTSRRYANTSGPDAEAAHRKVASFFEHSYPGKHQPTSGPSPTLLDPDERRRVDVENDRRRAAAFRNRAEVVRGQEAARPKPPAPAAVKPAGSTAAQMPLSAPVETQDEEDFFDTFVGGITKIWEADPESFDQADTETKVARVAAELAPGTGEVLSAKEAYHSTIAARAALENEDYAQALREAGNATLAGLGAIPLFGTTLRLSTKGVKLAVRLLDSLEKTERGAELVKAGRKASKKIGDSRPGRFVDAQITRVRLARAQKAWKTEFQELKINDLVPGLSEEAREYLQPHINRAVGMVGERHGLNLLERARIGLDRENSNRLVKIGVEGAKKRRFFDATVRNDIHNLFGICWRPISGKGDTGVEAKTAGGRLSKNQHDVEDLLEKGYEATNAGRNIAIAQSRNIRFRIGDVPAKDFREIVQTEVIDRALEKGMIRPEESSEILDELMNFQAADSNRNMPMALFALVAIGSVAGFASED